MDFILFSLADNINLYDKIVNTMAHAADVKETTLS